MTLRDTVTLCKFTPRIPSEPLVPMLKHLGFLSARFGDIYMLQTSINYKPAKKIPLAHRTARVRFAEDHLDFDWENEIVIFTDEKCFKSNKDGRKLSWRRSGERYNPKNLLDMRTSGRITLAYWGWMSSMGWALESLCE